MNHIPKILSQEIRNKIKYLNELSKKNSVRYQRDLLGKKREECALEKNAMINSYRLEHDSEKVPYNLPKNGGKKIIKEGIKNLKNAFCWGEQNLDLRKIDKKFIEELNYRIIPEIYLSGKVEYPHTSSKLLGASVSPPDPYKVQEKEFPMFFNYIRNNSNLSDPIQQMEVAIFSHFHLARIHPFFDGNGRTSRVLQDLILKHYQIPIPIINPGERNTYYLFLDKAVKDWKEQNNWSVKSKVTDGERDFYTFMAGKVNVSLDCLLDKLS